MTTFGCRVRKLRNRRHVNQATVAAALHINKTNISLWELNKELPEGAYLEALADYYEMSVEELIAGTNYAAEADPSEVDESAHAEENLTASEMYNHLPPSGKETVEEIVRLLYNFHKEKGWLV